MLLAPSLTVELAPVRARLDHRFDRQVVAATPSTERFAAIHGRLIRRSKQPGFDPGALVAAVRIYDSDAIRSTMRHVVGESRSLLAPWRPDRHARSARSSLDVVRAGAYRTKLLVAEPRRECSCGQARRDNRIVVIC